MGRYTCSGIAGNCKEQKRNKKLRFPFRCASSDVEERIAEEKAEREQARLAKDRRVCDQDVASEWCSGTSTRAGVGSNTMPHGSAIGSF